MVFHSVETSNFKVYLLWHSYPDIMLHLFIYLKTKTQKATNMSVDTKVGRPMCDRSRT